MDGRLEPEYWSEGLAFESRLGRSIWPRKRPDWLWVQHSPLFISYRGFVRGVKRPERDIHHRPRM